MLQLRRRPQILQQLVAIATGSSTPSTSQQSPQQQHHDHQQLWERLYSGQHCSSTLASPQDDAAAPPRAPRPPAAPWTPTRLLEKRKVYPKRMRFLITKLEEEYVSKVNQQRQLPDFRSGDILEVKVAVPEADRKVYTYRGVCLGRANKGPRTWFKLFNVFPDAGGVVHHFPLYMPDLLELRVLGRIPRAHRSKLYYLLDNESGVHTYQADVAPPK